MSDNTKEYKLEFLGFYMKPHGILPKSSYIDTPCKN